MTPRALFGHRGARRLVRLPPDSRSDVSCRSPTTANSWPMRNAGRRPANETGCGADRPAEGESRRRRAEARAKGPASVLSLSLTDRLSLCEPRTERRAAPLPARTPCRIRSRLHSATYRTSGRPKAALGWLALEDVCPKRVEGRPVAGFPPMWWRRGESNPRPKRPYVEILHAQSRLVFSSPRFRVGTARRDDQPGTSRTSPSGGGLRSQPGFLNRTSKRSRQALRVPSRLKPRVRVRCRWQLNFAVVFTSQTACSACSSIARCPVETGSPP